MPRRAVIQFTALAILLLNGARQPWQFVLAWGGAATVCAIGGMVVLLIGMLLAFRRRGWL